MSNTAHAYTSHSYLNVCGRWSSITSFIMWLPGTIEDIDKNGVMHAMLATYIPRLMLDTLCITASLQHKENLYFLNPIALILNTTGACGSLISLIIWTFYSGYNTNHHRILRYGIDTLQLYLCIQRLRISLTH